MKSPTLLLAVLILFNLIGFGQNSSEKQVFTGYSIRPHYGFVIIHSQDIVAVKDSYPIGLEIDAFRLNISQQAWNQCLCSPRAGISIGIWDFNSPDILGYGINPLVYIEPAFNVKNRLHFSFRGGAGLSLLSRPYDSVKNPNNLSYSTHIAFSLLAGVQLNYRINNRFSMQLAANFNHISNSGIKEPNKGINYPSASIGLTYFPVDPVFLTYQYVNWDSIPRDKNRLSFHILATNKQVELKRYYPIVGMGIQFFHQISRINAVGGELDLVWHGALDHRARTEGMSGDALSFGIGAGNEFLLGKFLFSQVFGLYIKKPVGLKQDVYQRYTLVYQVGDHFVPGLGLRAHGHVADFLDVRLGWRF